MIGPLLFNIDLCNLFFQNYSSDLTNFADYITPYGCGPTLYEVMNNLELTTDEIFDWFSYNNFKADASESSSFLFEYHINRMCRKASQKLHALSRIAKYIFADKKRMLLKPFLISQFSYC